MAGGRDMDLLTKLVIAVTIATAFCILIDISLLNETRSTDCVSVSAESTNDRRPAVQNNVDDDRFVAERQSLLAAPLDNVYLVPNVVYYTWCGEPRFFEFRHYVSVLSVVRYLHPDAIVMFYDEEPIVDVHLYNTWLSEIRERYPFFGVRRQPAACSNESFLAEQLRQNGGVRVQFDVVFARPAHEHRTRASFEAFDSWRRTVISMTAAGRSHNNGTSSSAACVPPSDYVIFDEKNGPLCVLMDDEVLPKDIWELDSALGQLLRTVVYGKPNPTVAVPSYDTLAPNIGHMIWIGGGSVSFDFYLAVLSLLNVAKVKTVYIHGDTPPNGSYWDLIRKDSRVRFVRRVVSSNYGDARFQKNPIFVSDYWRIDILRLYGGIYLDSDAVMVRPLTRELRAYGAVVAKDINTAANSPYPDTINVGVAVAKPDAPFWRFYQRQSKLFVETDYFWTSVRLPYKLKELHPETLHIEPHLQVLCYASKCRPTWHPDYRNADVNHVTRPDLLEDWKNVTFSFHFTYPTPAEFVSPAALLSGSGLIADVGRYILEQSHMLEYFRTEHSDQTTNVTVRRTRQ